MKRWFVWVMLMVLAVMCCACSSSPKNPDAATNSSGKGESSGSASDIIGSVVSFGRYEQDGNTGNGQEAIEWIILDVQDGKALLLSRYALDAMPYNTSETAVTWESCSLRSWLNNEFLNAAFNDREKAGIQMTHVDNGDTQRVTEWNSVGGNDTQDRVFLLSNAEVTSYIWVRYDGNRGAIAYPTAYARQRGAWIDLDRTDWWIRSPGRNQANAAFVCYDGTLSDATVDCNEICIRPAIRVSLNDVVSVPETRPTDSDEEEIDFG